MKKILSQLEAIKEKLELKLEQREEYFVDRSDKWRESEKGDLYQDKTDELQNVIDSIDESIMELQTFLNV